MAREGLEQPGGKGANQAVGLAQMGVHPALIAAVGADPAGRTVIETATADGVDVSAVAIRAHGSTSLIVSAVEAGGTWRYLEDLTPLPSALRRTALLLRQLPRDRVTARGLLEALSGLPWVLRERRPVPPELERGYRLLETMQLEGEARRYVS